MPKKKVVSIPSAYPNDASARPQVLKKGRPANNPQATKLGTALDSAVGAVVGGLQGHRTAAQEKRNAVLRRTNPGRAFDEDVNAAIKTTKDFYRMKSAPPIPGAKGIAAAARMKKGGRR